MNLSTNTNTNTNVNMFQCQDYFEKNFYKKTAEKIFNRQLKII